MPLLYGDGRTAAYRYDVHLSHAPRGGGIAPGYLPDLRDEVATGEWEPPQSPLHVHHTAHSHDTPAGRRARVGRPDARHQSPLRLGNMIWQLVDRDTGAANGEIVGAFAVGDQVKIRLVNDMNPIIPCTTPSTSTAPAVSSFCLGTVSRSESRVEGHRARPSEPVDILSTSRIPGCGWRTVTSPSTTRAA